MNLNRVRTVRSLVPVRRALVSVADKAGIDELVRGLWSLNRELEIYSTGGTFRRIAEIAAEMLGPTHPCSGCIHTGDQCRRR